MILQSLLNYYEALAAKGEIARLGWGQTRVQYALEIDANGALLSVRPLEATDEKGKPLPRYLELPAPVKRTVGIAANFLWDNSAYLLGLDGKGKPERAKKCFEAATALHLALLSGSEDPFAAAICAFFGSWQPESASETPCISEMLEALTSGANLTFMYEQRLPDGSPALARIWQNHYDGGAAQDETIMRCLVTGEGVVPEAVHPAIKRVRGAQPVGAALVSFNAPAFESYDREQNLNAPVGKYAAFAYTTALNQLVSDSAHSKYIGDTTVVYWAESAEQQYRDAFSAFMEGETVSDNDLNGVIEALSAGRPVNWSGLPLLPENHFYVLGIAPNAARLSVRFFLRDEFGSFARNLDEHYKRLEIVRPDYDGVAKLSLWRMLNETVNPNSRDKTPSPNMAGDTIRAILIGTLYPATLYQQTMLRIKAERSVSRGKAAIIKAYILRNSSNDKLKEAATVALNEQSNYTPYVLGRLFSLLENIQDSASGASTVKDRFFNSACATPASIFPLLLKLKNSHTRVLLREKPGLCILLEKETAALIDKLDASFPTHLTLEEQGAFILGYYHQTQKRYEKKDKQEDK